MTPTQPPDQTLPRTRRKFLQLSFRAALAVLLWLAPSAAQQPQRVTLTLLSTTDIHGSIYPVDEFTNRPANRGLAKIATLVKQVRAENPNALLFDCGDTIEGNRLAFYYARKDSSGPNPTIAAMNAMHYDAMAFGNHDFNFGLDIQRRARRESAFPWLSANIRSSYSKSSPEYILPYVIKEVSGIRVAIVGFTTPGVPYWEVPANYRGYKFEDIVAAAKRTIPEVRKQADLVVALSHAGLGRDEVTGAPIEREIPVEDQTWDLAEQVPGIDVIFLGHTHREVPEKIINGVLLAQPSNWGRSLARAEVELERGDGGRWKVVSKKSRVIPVTDRVAADPQILAIAKNIFDATERYLDTPVGTLSEPLNGRTGRVEDTPLVDLIHRVQMEYGKADVSMATMFIPTLRWEPGPITVRQLSVLYAYDNTLYTIRMTGAQLKEALEHSVSFFPAWPRVAGKRFSPPGYQADSAQGVEYKIDLTRPVGDRIRDLTFHGKPLAPNQKLRVAINNYRDTGGGGYKVYKKLPIVYRSNREVIDLLVEYVSRIKQIPTTTDHNWEIIPAEARQALIEATAPRPATAAAAPGAR